MLKGIVCLIALTVLSAVSSGYGQQIGIRGRVVDENHQPIQGAQVKLVNADESQNTDWDGRFFIDMTHTSVITDNPVSSILSFRNGTLFFAIAERLQTVRLEVFDHKGKRVSSAVQKTMGTGTHSIKLFQDDATVALYIVKLQIGNRTGMFNVLNLKNRVLSLSGKGLQFESSLLKRYADVKEVIDTLEVKKDGYDIRKMAINSYSTDVPDIVLEDNGSNDEGLPPVTNGKQARTTRYWDCCKPHCGWHSNMRMCDISNNDLWDQGAGSGCDGGSSFQCWDYSPIEINSKVSYGWAAFNNSGTNCGDCFQLDFQGSLQGKQMIVQVINIGDGGNDAFDLLIPGGGVGALNGCSRQWNNAPLGERYGGFHSTCGNNADCIRGMCQAAFGDKADLMRGCEWYLTWFQMTSNPNVVYMKVSCPQKIKDISRIGN
ncbi:MAG: hypothetical protein JW863_12855 [Chitinispirillaceae bacterium]|nr:hypothetical protein [Chitinispirillaceae bacterium]